MKRAIAGIFLLAALAGAFVWISSSGRSLPFAHKARPASPGGPDASPADQSGRTRAEREAVDRVRREGFHPAEDADGTDSDVRRDLEDVYGEYHPFFVRGDVDGDGRLDFVQAFVRTVGGEPWFDVAVFFGKPDGTFGEPVWVERAASLAAGDLAIDRSLVVVTPDLESEGVRRWRWDAQDHRFVDADSGTGETEGEQPAEDPGERLRAKA